MAAARRVNPKVDRVAESYRLRQLTGPDGKPKYTWEQIADKLGYKSYRGALMAAERYEAKLGNPDRGDRWQALLPWWVAPEEKVRYFYRMCVLYLKDREGVTLNAQDAGQLALFLDALGKPYPEGPLGDVLFYDEDMPQKWARRPRAEADPTDPFVVE